jgi:hypothetical protein
VDGYKRHLADQIAMKIMPKLRGVDLADNSQAFNRLDPLIQEIGDNGLTEAYDSARRSSQGFFQWQGISWSD